MIITPLNPWLMRPKQRELKLKKRDERNLIWVKNSPDPIVLLTQGQILLANPAALQMLGYDSKAQIIKVPPKRLLSEAASPDQAQGAIRAAKTALGDHGAHRVAWPLKHRDGHTISTEISLTKVPFNQN